MHVLQYNVPRGTRAGGIHARRTPQGAPRPHFPPKEAGSGVQLAGDYSGIPLKPYINTHTHKIYHISPINETPYHEKCMILAL